MLYVTIIRLDVVTFQKLTNFFDKVGIAKATTRVPQVVIKFHKDNVRTYWEEDKNFSIHYSNRPSVIGPINHRCQWLVVVDQHIRLFDVKRLCHMLTR